MKLRSYPAEALMLIEIAQLFKQKMVKTNASQTIVDSNTISERRLDHDSYISQQDIVISDQELHSKCTSAEWHLIGRISLDLKMNNTLWKWPQELLNNSSVRKAIRGLILKNILSKTSVTHIYIVNPAAIRRGKDWKVALSTAQAIFDNNGVDITLIRDLRAVDTFNFTNSQKDMSQQIGYGFTVPDYSKTHTKEELENMAQVVADADACFDHLNDILNED